jgi:predicted adenine nucleotide alpha hydrolase (AANH) superfamily ATPase
MKILVHMCCGPCAITPVRALLDAGMGVTGLYYNPNIHPLQEYLRRREGVAQVAERLGIRSSSRTTSTTRRRISGP